MYSFSWEISYQSYWFTLFKWWIIILSILQYFLFGFWHFSYMACSWFNLCLSYSGFIELPGCVGYCFSISEKVFCHYFFKYILFLSLSPYLLVFHHVYIGTFDGFTHFSEALFIFLHSSYILIFPNVCFSFFIVKIYS